MGTTEEVRAPLSMLEKNGLQKGREAATMAKLSWIVVRR